MVLCCIEHCQLYLCFYIHVLNLIDLKYANHPPRKHRGVFSGMTPRHVAVVACTTGM